MSVTTLTAKELRRAADIKERIDSLQNELNQLLGNGVSAPSGEPKARRWMSAAGKARIAAAAKARWAAYRKAKGKAENPTKRKNKMSAAGRAAIAAAAKARWAKAKAQGKSRL